MTYVDIEPEDEKTTTQMDVFPNPGSDYIVFQNACLGSEFFLELFDTKGNIVHSEIFSSLPHSLQVGQFPVSSYFFKITSANSTEQFSGRFLVE